MDALSKIVKQLNVTDYSDILSIVDNKKLKYEFFIWGVAVLISVGMPALVNSVICDDTELLRNKDLYLAEIALIIPAIGDLVLINQTKDRYISAIMAMSGLLICIMETSIYVLIALSPKIPNMRTSTIALVFAQIVSLIYLIVLLINKNCERSKND